MAYNNFVHGRKLPVEVKEKMRAMYAAGEKYTVIQAELGVADTTITRHCYPARAPRKRYRPSHIVPVRNDVTIVQSEPSQ